MDKEFVMATAKTIEQQILWSINKWEYLSWGVSKKAAIEYEGMATLALRVSGAVHKGWVFISLNEGMDCYEVRLLNVARTKVKRMLDEVYCDNLGEVLDGLIERKTEWTDEQYKRKAARDSARKMGMEVLDTSKNNSKTETMAKNEVKFRPATMAEIEGRDTDLYMDGEQVWVMMIHRSETIGEGELKLDYIMLTNMKKVQVEDLQVIDNNNNEPEEETTMATKKNNNETKNVQNAQVNNSSNNAIEDVSVGEVTVDSIMPVMQPVEEKKADVRCEKADVKPQTSSIEHHPSNIIHHPSSIEHQVQDSVPQAGKYQYVTYEVKKVNKTTKKEYTVTGSKIVGFELTDPIYLAGPAFCGAISTESADGKTVGALRFSHKWTPAVKDVCDLLNSGKATLEGCVAIINGAKAERSERIQERIAKREERKTKKDAAPAAKPQGTVTAGYSDQDVADMLRKVMAGGDVPENIKKLLQAA